MATHDVSVSPRYRQKGTKTSEGAEPPTMSDRIAECKKELTKAQLDTGNKIKVLRSDIGGEYVLLIWIQQLSRTSHTGLVA